MLIHRFRSTALLLTIIATAFAPLAARADTELGGKMKVIGRSLKAVGTAASSADAPLDEKPVAEAIAAAKAAKELSPAKLESVPEADKAKFTESYKKEIDKLIDALNKLDDAVKSGKKDDVKTALAALPPIKNEGHREFIKKEGRGGKGDRPPGPEPK